MRSGVFVIAVFVAFLCAHSVAACTSSTQCTTGSALSCCDGHCHEWWDCAANACAKGERYVKNQSPRICLNESDPCSAEAQAGHLCPYGAKCMKAGTENNGDFSCAACPAGSYGKRCEFCQSSTVCTFGSRANCCRNKCTTSEECEKEGSSCASGEKFVPNHSVRSCLSTRDPCSAEQQVGPLCPYEAPTKCVNGLNKDGDFSCDVCPSGATGKRCEFCSTSAVCTFGAMTNCCNNTCTSSYYCPSKKCAANEEYVPNHSERSCLDFMHPCKWATVSGGLYNPCGFTRLCVEGSAHGFSCQAS